MQRGVIVALGSAVLFGLSTPLAKMLVGDVSPLMLAGLLYAGSGVGLTLLLAWRRATGIHPPAISLPARAEWRWLAGAIVFGGIAGPVALMYGLAQTAASTASLLLNLESALTALLAWFVFGENFDRRIMLGMLAIVAGGIVLASTPGGSGAPTAGWTLIAVACLCWAIDNNLTRKASTSDATLIAALKGLVAGAVNLGLATLLGQSLPSIGIIGLSVAVGFFGYGVSLSLFIVALRHLGVARASAYFAVAPFIGAALAIALQGDPVSWQFIAAGLLMAGGVVLHVSEHHGHLHGHEPQQHTHAHSHDAHHRHSHAADWDGSEPHTHAHVHRPLVHAHEHFPDVHHRHTHERIQGNQRIVRLRLQSSPSPGSDPSRTSHDGRAGKALASGTVFANQSQVRS